jgi:predicted glycosyltransferase involved in capsule biosynthesis
MSTEFSIVTIVKHRTPQLNNLLSSIERSSLLPKEMIIVWMASPSDESLLSSDSFNIQHCFATHSELPIAKARNRGFDACTSNRIIYLDVDCLCPETLLQTMTEQLTNGRVVSANITDLPCQAEEVTSSVLKELAAMPVKAAEQQPFVHFDATAFAITKEDFSQLGGFDTDYDGYGFSDVDFAMRCSQAGLTLVNTGRHVFKQFHMHFNPPLNHLCDLVANAELFKQKWSCYPFCDYFEKFAELGYVNEDYEQTGLRVTRLASEEELDAFFIEQPCEEQPEVADDMRQTA